MLLRTKRRARSAFDGPNLAAVLRRFMVSKTGRRRRFVNRLEGMGIATRWRASPRPLSSSGFESTLRGERRGGMIASLHATAVIIDRDGFALTRHMRGQDDGSSPLRRQDL